MNNELSSLFRAIVVAAMIAGTLDICAACLQAYFMGGVVPMRVLQYVASGVFGPEAFRSGMQGALAGLGLHYLIAYSWSVLLFFVYPLFLKISSALAQNLIIMGVLYGIFVWSVMNLVVVPNSAVQTRPFDLLRASIGAVIIIICVGFPLVWRAQRFYAENNKKA